MKKSTSNRNAKLWLILPALILAVALGYQLVQRTNAQSQKESPFNEQRAFKDLETLVGFGPRPAGSAAIAKTRAYIVAELEKAGLKPQLDEFEGKTPRGPVKMVNIRAVRPGSKPGIIALTGHYDTKIFNFNFVGANDGGSSAAWLLEMARVTADLKLEHTLEFIFFDGEEAVLEWTDDDSVYGSRYDVERRTKAGNLRDLKALVLVDMIGDKSLNIKKETSSTRWLTTILWDTARTLKYTREFTNEEQAINDDHIPYLKAGVQAVDIIDFDYPCTLPCDTYWHVAADTLDKTSGRSLKIVGDVVYLSLPQIDRRASQ